MEDSPKCPWCGAEYHKQIGDTFEYDCGTKSWIVAPPHSDEYRHYIRDAQCYERQIQNLQAKVAKLKAFAKHVIEEGFYNGDEQEWALYDEVKEMVEEKG